MVGCAHFRDSAHGVCPMDSILFVELSGIAELQCHPKWHFPRHIGEADHGWSLGALLQGGGQCVG